MGMETRKTRFIYNFLECGRGILPDQDWASVRIEMTHVIYSVLVLVMLGCQNCLEIHWYP